MNSGRRIVCIISNLLCIGFSVLSIYENLWVMAVARLGFGLASGVIVAAAPKLLEETVPAHLIDKGFGVSTNMLINAGLMINTLIAVGNPDNTNYDELNDSSFWKVIYGFGIVPCALSLLMFLCIHREDSLIFYLEKDRDEEADKVLARIYSQEDQKTRDQIKSILKMQLKDSDDTEEEEVGMWKCLTHPDYRRATWVCIGVATANQWAGINIINIFSTDIFTRLHVDDGIDLQLDVKTMNYFIGGSGFLGSFLANFTVGALSRRTLFLLG